MGPSPVPPAQRGTLYSNGRTATNHMSRVVSSFHRVAVLLLSGVLSPHPSSAQEKTVQLNETELRKAATVKIEPEYPAVARQIRLTGDVELEVTIDAAGSVDKVTVRRGNTLLAGPSVQAVKRWKFSGFRADGQPARAVGPIKFSFQI
jgi:TonB family protein